MRPPGGGHWLGVSGDDDPAGGRDRDGGVAELSEVLLESGRGWIFWSMTVLGYRKGSSSAPHRTSPRSLRPGLFLYLKPLPSERPVDETQVCPRPIADLDLVELLRVRKRIGGCAMDRKTLLVALMVFMACRPALAQPGQAPLLPQASQTSSQSQPSPSVDQDRAACERDVNKLCPQAGGTPRPGDQTVLNCLVTHKAELTEACRKNVESHAGITRNGASR